MTPSEEAGIPAENPVEEPAEQQDEEPALPWPEDAVIVTITEDSGPGSFREALEAARENDHIVFDPAVFPPDDPAVILLTEELPHIRTAGLTIDASNAGVILDGSRLDSEWVMGFQLVETEAITIMGLQISNFSGPGIGVYGTSDSVIGGDRSTGAGPWGQGNLISGNTIGIDISDEGTIKNTITGNLVGVDLEGSEWLGNERNGIQLLGGSTDNTIGPDNIIANNGEYGIYTSPEVTLLNTRTSNEIYDNGIGRGEPYFPSIFDFDIAAGTMVGATCPNCAIEVFSASGWEGEILEAETTADELGIFTINKGEAFSGPFLNARVTDAHGNMSFYTYPPTSQTERMLVVQSGNTQPRTQYYFALPRDIADNHIANNYDGIDYEDDFTDLSTYRSGVSRLRASTNGLEPETDKWENPEMPLSQAQQDHFTRLAEEGIIVNFAMVFWDKENHPNGEGLPCYRFQTEEEIERWLVYVRYIVESLHDRVQYFEIWNEPDIPNYCPKSIYLDDYLNLVRLTVPVIRDAAPEAKIIIGGVSGTAYDDAYNYLMGVISSDVMPLVDVVNWHPMYNFTPDIARFRSYYYAYPGKIQEIMDTAAANGFEGEFQATEISFNRKVDLGDEFPTLTEIERNKYFLQSALMHRGEGIDIGLGSGYFVVHRLCTVMAGVEPEEFPVEIETTADHLFSYTFSNQDGEKLVAAWRHTQVAEFDPGIEATLTIPDASAGRVVAVDLLYNMEQELFFELVDGDLVIENLLIRDYPVLIRLEP